jgi:hypothetical protein
VLDDKNSTEFDKILLLSPFDGEYSRLLALDDFRFIRLDCRILKGE